MLNDTKLQSFLKAASIEIKNEILKMLSQQKNQIFNNAKNIEAGNIQAAENVHIVDIHNHGNIKLPKELTDKLPKLNKDNIIGREENKNVLRKHLFATQNKQLLLVNGLG